MNITKTVHDDGWVLRIDTDHGISVVTDPVVIANSLWLAVNRYTESSYEVRYLEIVDGEVVRDVHEKRGLLPSLFLHDGEPWARLQDPFDDKDLEIFAPILDRESDPQRFQPFKGTNVGVHEGKLYLHRNDGPKGDRLLPVSLGPKVKRGKQIKLSFPYNKIVIEEDGLHALSNQQPYVHRRLGPAGEVLHERTLHVDVGDAKSWAQRPISLSKGDLLVLAGGDIRRLRFDAEGAQTSSTILATWDSLNNLWPVQRTAKGFVTAFNGSVSGWIYFTDEGTREVFTTTGSAAGFTDASGNLLELMEGSWPTPAVAAGENQYYAIGQPESLDCKSLFIVARAA